MAPTFETELPDLTAQPRLMELHDQAKEQGQEQSDPVTRFFRDYAYPRFHAFMFGPKPVPVEEGAAEAKPLVDPEHPLSKTYSLFQIDQAYKRYQELQDSYGNTAEGRQKAVQDPELLDLAQKIAWVPPTGLDVPSAEQEYNAKTNPHYVGEGIEESPEGKAVGNIATMLNRTPKVLEGEAGAAEPPAKPEGEPVSAVGWADRYTELRSKYPNTVEGAQAAIRDPEVMKALINSRGYLIELLTNWKGTWKTLGDVAESTRPFRRVARTAHDINVAGKRTPGQAPTFEHITDRGAPDEQLPQVEKPAGLTYDVNPSNNGMRLLRAQDKAMGGAGEVTAIRDTRTGDISAWPSKMGDHGALTQAVTGNTIEPGLTTPERLPGEMATPTEELQKELPEPDIMGGAGTAENHGASGTDRLTDAPLHEQRVAVHTPYRALLMGGRRAGDPPRTEDIQAETFRQKMAADAAGVSQQGAAAIAIQHPDNVDATYAELQRQRSQEEPFSFTGMEERAGRPPSMFGAAMDVLSTMAQTPLALLAGAVSAPKAVYDSYKWLHDNPMAAWGDDPAQRSAAYQHALNVAGALNLSETLGVAQTEGSMTLGAGGVRGVPTFHGKPSGWDKASQDVTPSRANASAVTGVPVTSSSTVTPPLTHTPFFQVSTRPEPSASSTKRPTSPLTLTGPTETFDRSRLGSIDQTSRRVILQGSSDYKALTDNATKIQPALDAALRDTIADIPGAALYGSRVKKLSGIEAKMATGRPPETISDYLGARIVVKDAASLDKVAKALQDRFNVLHVDDFLDQGKFGYRAVHAQVDLGNGTTAELQLVPEAISAVQKQAHALREPVKRLGEQADLTPEQVALVKDTHAKVQGTFEGAWNPEAFYATREQPTSKAITAVDLRALPYPVALEVAKTQRHVIPGQDGQFVGAPRGMTSRQKLNAVRRKYDGAVDQGMDGSRWYSEARGAIQDVAGMDPARQSLLARQWALFSPQASVDQNLGFQLAAHNAWLAGHPLDIAHTGVQARTFNKAMDTGAEIPLKQKTGVFANTLDPTQPLPSTGTNDIWQGRAMGYDVPGGESSGFSPQEHAFMDAETVLATDRANQRKAGGRSDWSPSEVQAAAWVSTKGTSDGLKFYESGQNVDPKTGKKAFTKEEAIAKGIKAAARTYPDFFPKYTAFMTEEDIPYVKSDHMAGLSSAPDDVKRAYSDAANWRDIQGRDRLAADLGMFVRSSTEATGLYHPPGGGVTEFNPMAVARPLVGFSGPQGNRTVDPNSAALLDSIGAIKGYMGVQGAVPWHLAKANNSMKNSAGYRVPMGRVVSHDELDRLDQLMGPKGLMPVPTGDGITVIPREWGDPAPITQALKGGLDAQIRQILPDAGEGTFRAGISGGYPSFEDELTAERAGKGAATEKLFQILDANPGIFRRADAAPSVRAMAIAQFNRDADIWTWENGASGKARADVQAARKIMGSSDRPLTALRAALKSGEIALPAVLLYSVLSGIPSGGDGS